LEHASRAVGGHARPGHPYVWEAGDLVALNERADPVLADLWNNPKDAAYDKL
jgi:hypothetical protein